MAYAYHEIKQNRAQGMLATGTDENSAVIEKLYGQLGLVADGDAKLYGGTGMALSDGSVSVALENAASAAKHGGKKYAKVAGYGMIIGTGDGPLTTVYEFEDHIAREGNENGSAFGGKKPVHNVRTYIGEARSAAATLSVAHAALTLSGDLPASQKAFFFENGVEEKEVDTTAYKNVLVVAVGVGGSYSAVVLQKA